MGLCLVCLHPNNSDYQLIEVPVMEKEMVDIFEFRREMLNAKKKPDKKPIEKKTEDKKTKTIINYFTPSEKKGSGLLLNLNNI